LYDRSGRLTVSYDLFKAVMIVVFSCMGCYAIFHFFRAVHHDYVRHGMIAGIAWLLINWLMDVIVLLPISKTSVTDYFSGIGLGYLQILAISIGAGYLVNYKMKTLKI
jgi:hypothetical protein